MRDTKNNHNYKFFIYLSLFWIAIAWGAYLLTLAGIFYWWSISLLISLITAGGIRFIFSNLLKTSKNFLIFNIIFILIATVFVYFSTPTVFSGRDQASISQASIRLAQNGKIAFSTSVSEDFFKINNIQEDKIKNCLIDKLDDFQNNNSLEIRFYQTYCQALTSTKAFNFPGFYYTDDSTLVTQFPLVYISWLAIFYSFLGLWGFSVANGILLYLFFLSFYLIIVKVTEKEVRSLKEKMTIQMLGMTLLITSFCFMWFGKFTLTENMATPLLWTGILSILLLADSSEKELKNKNYEFLLIFMSLGLLIFTRIEGLAFFTLAILFIFLNKKTRKYLKSHLLKIFLPLMILISLIFIWNLIVDIYLYKSILKATLDNLQENSQDLSGDNSLLSIVNLFKILGLYGILTPIIFGIAGIFYLVKKKKYTELIPLFIIFPALFYLLSPQITPEHPWMLRRFVFAILPLFIFYSIILVSNFSKKKNIIWGILIFIVILFFNLRSFVNYLQFVPGNNLLEGTAELSQNFSDKDLLLVDQLTSGDKYEMIADPLSSIFDKNAVYFFNYHDLEKIDTGKYERIYLIIPEEKIEYYQKTPLAESMVFIKKYSLRSDSLILNDTFDFPKKETRLSEGSIFEIIR